MKKRASKRLDVAGIREVLRDHREWVKFGTVIADDDGGARYQILDGDDGNQSDIFVRVELTPTKERMWCHCLNLHGLMLIPRLGWEVIVAVPDGEFVGQPCIVGVLPSGNVPSLIDANPEDLIISCDENVRISATDDVILQGGSARVARVGDTVDVALGAVPVQLVPAVTIGYTVPTTLSGVITSGAAKVKA
jgi:hypothetical protein